jgi:hypothetical protein
MRAHRIPARSRSATPAIAMPMIAGVLRVDFFVDDVAIESLAVPVLEEVEGDVVAAPIEGFVALLLELTVRLRLNAEALDCVVGVVLEFA